MKVAIPFLSAALLLAGCGEHRDVNPPTEPAAPVGRASTAPSAGPSSIAASLPGAGPANFVGRWAANVEWCAFPEGERRPIEITVTRFEGYENRCDIRSITQRDGGYEATLDCLGEGETFSERVLMVVSDEVMTLTYLDRDSPRVGLTRCTTLDDTPRVSAAPGR